MAKLQQLYLICAFIFWQISNSIAAQSLANGIHRTQAATERINDLWCYKCDTMDDGEQCLDLLSKNNTNFVQKCRGEEFVCMVKRFSYTTSTENSTSAPKMWSLDRRCAVNCEPGCIVIGERTKLYSCTSCCEQNLCNMGRGRGSALHSFRRVGIGTLRLIFLNLAFTYPLWFIYLSWHLTQLPPA